MNEFLVLISATSLKKENLPTGLKHIKDNEEDEKKNKES